MPQSPHQRQMRLPWIEASVRYTGRFASQEKKAYTFLFGVSEPTVARDQATFCAEFEAACGRQVFERDTDGRVSGGRLTLVRGVELPAKTVYPRVPSVRTWLPQILQKQHYCHIDSIRSAPRTEVLRVVMQGMLSKHALQLKYHTRSSHTGVVYRTVSPLAIVDVVDRLHLRAFDHSVNSQRDFVLTRILEAAPDSTPYIANDPDWNEDAQLLIKERPSEHNPHATIGVRLDFGLDGNGERLIRVKKAIAPYIADIKTPEMESPVTIETVTKHNISD